MAKSDRKYGVIVADPAWEYDNKRTGGSMKSGSAAHYPTMSFEEICNLPVKNIADRNCVLYLWVTVPFMHYGLHVMEAWGFKFKTALFWRKLRKPARCRRARKRGFFGMGFWFRGQVEMCLVGTRGKVKAFRLAKPNFFEASIGRHSEKPARFFELIEPVSEYPRIELFCRGKPRDGWDGWGNQTHNGVELW